jgi:hypothetical protein
MAQLKYLLLMGFGVRCGDRDREGRCASWFLTGATGDDETGASDMRLEPAEAPMSSSLSMVSCVRESPQAGKELIRQPSGEPAALRRTPS